MENLEIRMLVAALKLTYKQIAQKMGICREHLSRIMRYPLKPEMETRIMAAIDALRGEKGDAV